MFDKSSEEDKEKEREGGGGEEKEEGGEKETNASISLIWPSQRLHLSFHLYIHVCFFYSSGFKSCKFKSSSPFSAAEMTKRESLVRS